MGSTAPKSLRPKLALALTFALLAGAPAAVAVEGDQTREGYVAAVEPVCKKSSQTNARILKGVKGQVNAGKLVPAGKRFVRAAGVLGRTVSEISKVPRPSADAVKLKKWIGHLGEQRTYLQRIGQALKAKNRGKASQYAVKLNKSNRQANNTVISFGFKECRIESSRYL